MATPKELTPEQRIAQLEAQLKEANAEKEAQAEIIATQEEQLAAATKQGEGQLSVVTHAGKQYQVLAGKFSLDDNVIHHHELKGKPELVAKLVNDNSPLLQVIEKAEAAK